MKFIKSIAYFFLAFVLACLVAVFIIWNGEIATLSSLHQVDGDKYLYEMEFKAGYDLDEVLDADMDANKKLLDYAVHKIGKGLLDEHCTSFQAKNSSGEGWLYGRNYDFFKNPSLVIVSRPEKGYASIAMSDLSHLGLGLEKLPDCLRNKVFCLAAIYAPMDGMNEKGFCTSIMALPKQAAYQESGHHKVGASILMRLWLDRCATVDEAIELLDNVDVCFDQEAGSGYHFMVADASGNTAVIEFDKYDGWKTMVTRKAQDKNFMVVTNHLVAPKYYTAEPNPEFGNPHSKSWWRYGEVSSYLSAKNGVISKEEAQECLAKVHWKDLVWDNGLVENTQWSAVYDQSELTLTLRSWSDYEKSLLFSL